MSPSRARLAEPLLQLLVVVPMFVVMHTGWWPPATFAVIGLAVVWPARVRWLPAAVRSVLVAYIPFAVAWLAFTVLYLRGMHLLGWTVAPQPLLQQLAEQGAALPEFWAVVVSIVVVAPLFEEVVFRGYLFTGLGALLPRAAVHLVTAAAFGLVHGLHYALPIGVLALLFGWLRARHDALLPSILAHAMHNGLTVVAAVAWPAHLELLYPR